jgi:hypothetical protein
VAREDRVGWTNQVDSAETSSRRIAKSAKNRCAKTRSFPAFSTRLGLSSPSLKNIVVSFYRKIWFTVAIPPQAEGVRVVTIREAGRDGRVDAVACSFARGRMAEMRTVKSYGPDTPTLVSGATRASALSLTRRSFASRGYGGQQARRTRESTKQP